MEEKINSEAVSKFKELEDLATENYSYSRALRGRLNTVVSRLIGSDLESEEDRDPEDTFYGRMGCSLRSINDQLIAIDELIAVLYRETDDMGNPEKT